MNLKEWEGTQLPELKHDTEQKYCVDKFLEKRRGKKTIPYTKAIIGCLSKQFDSDSQHPDIKKDIAGWVVCSRLLEEVRGECPGIRDSTFYRILGELKDNHLIERRGKPMKPYRPGRVPVYYRVPVLHARAWFDSKEELMDSFIFVLNALNRDARLIRAAKNLLKQCHSNDPEYNAGSAILLESLRILEMEKKGLYML